MMLAFCFCFCKHVFYFSESDLLQIETERGREREREGEREEGERGREGGGRGRERGREREGYIKFTVRLSFCPIRKHDCVHILVHHKYFSNGLYSLKRHIKVQTTGISTHEYN